MFGNDRMAATARRLGMGLLASALLSGAAMAEGIADTGAHPLPISCTPEHCRVTADRRTTHEARPMEFRGSTSFPVQRDILLRYDDTFGCLVPEARDGPDLDLLALDWATLLDPAQDEALRFCLLRLLSTLDDIELAEAWAHGAGFERLERFTPFVTAPHVGPRPAAGLWGFWDAAQWHRHRPTRLHDWFGITPVRSAVLTILFDEEGQVLEAMVHGNSTFN